MFGYIGVDYRTLEKADKARYQAVYCGLCRCLSERYGSAGRSVLSYDMTFVSILLSSLYGTDETEHEKRCILHPLRKGIYRESQTIEYAADMNILLAYYQYLDDWNDDCNKAALKKSERLAGWIPQIREHWPRQVSVVAECMDALGEMEEQNEMNPDRPANCFGELLGEIFAMREDEWSAGLRRMGAALGRFVYLLDACNDLRADIMKERYNPLIAQTDTDFKPMLAMVIGECTSEFETLPFKRDMTLMRNVLYSGVWTRYVKRKGDGTHDGRPI